MTMNPNERSKVQQMISRFKESDEPLPANMAVFRDEQGKMLYAGLISKWPLIIAADIEWGEVREMDATKPPFAGKNVKFYSPPFKDTDRG
jgi:hypothetical protein